MNLQFMIQIKINYMLLMKIRFKKCNNPNLKILINMKISKKYNINLVKIILNLE